MGPQAQLTHMGPPPLLCTRPAPPAPSGRRVDKRGGSGPFRATWGHGRGGHRGSPVCGAPGGLLAISESLASGVPGASSWQECWGGTMPSQPLLPAWGPASALVCAQPGGTSIIPSEEGRARSLQASPSPSPSSCRDGSWPRGPRHCPHCHHHSSTADRCNLPIGHSLPHVHLPVRGHPGPNRAV